MPRLLIVLLASVLLAAAALAQSSPIEFDMMTWPEVKKAQEQGKTTVLVFNGGTEQRGPHNVNGGHTLMARAIVKGIAEKLGNAIWAPVLPFSVIDTNPSLPGSIGITAPLFAQVNEQVAEQLIKDGFKSVVLMGDHGGGQTDLAEVAKKLDAKYASQGIRVVFSGDVYRKAEDDISKWLLDNGYGQNGHAGTSDTSLMLYLGGDKNWVRKDLVATALGDPAGKADPNVPRRNNGITGDGRRSTAELGQRFFDQKVDYAVRQIRQLLAK